MSNLRAAEASNSPLENNQANGVALLWRLAALGATAFALTLTTLFAFRLGGDNAYMAAAIASGFVALAATRVAERASGVKALLIIGCVALLLRGMVLSLDPLLSTDIYRYVWDGKVQAHGVNPYRYFPADEALASLRDEAIYPNINRAHYAVTIYSPVAQMFFFLATRFGESTTTMRLALLGCEAGLVTLIVLLLRRLGQPLTRIVAYAWHPLPIWEIANNGHIDALMVMLMMLGLWFGVIGRPLQGAASIALAALAKPFAVITLSAIWRPWDWKLPLVAVAVVAICYLPYLSVGWGVFGFLTTGYLTEENIASGNNVWALAVWRLVFGQTPLDTIMYFTVASGALAAAAMVVAHREQGPAGKIADIKRLLLALLLLLSPNYPWYFLIVTPFVALGGGAPVWIMTIGAVMLQEENQWDHHLPILIRKSIHFGAFLTVCAYSAWGGSRQIERRKFPCKDETDA